MSTRAALGFPLLLAFSLAYPAMAADELNIPTLKARLAARPTGPEAERSPAKSATGSATTGKGGLT